MIILWTVENHQREQRAKAMSKKNWGRHHISISKAKDSKRVIQDNSHSNGEMLKVRKEIAGVDSAYLAFDWMVKRKHD